MSTLTDASAGKVPSLAAAMQKKRLGGKQVGWAEVDQLARMIDALMEAALSNAKQVAAIQSRGIEFKGVWQPAQDYSRGQLATYRGSIWHCNCATTRDQPGTSTSWTLAAKGTHEK